MITVSTDWEDQVASSSQQWTQEYKVYDGSGTFIAPLTGVVSGSVTMDLNAQVRRRLTLEVARNQIAYEEGEAPADPENTYGGDPGDTYDDGYYSDVAFTDYSGLLIPRVREIWVYDKLYIEDTTSWESILVGKFRVTDLEIELTNDLTVYQVEAEDRSIMIKDSGWTIPKSVNAGDVIVDAIEDILTDRWVDCPALVVGSGVSAVKTISKSVHNDLKDLDPWEACQRLAALLNAELFFGTGGAPNLRKNRPSTTAVVAYKEGSTNRNILSLTRRISAQDTYSGVRVAAQSHEKDISEVVWDAYTDSPTYYLGDFGKKLMMVDSDEVDTSVEAGDLAEDLLEQVRAFQDEIDFEATRNPALEPGDTISVKFPNADIYVWTKYQITTISMGLGIDTMSVNAVRLVETS